MANILEILASAIGFDKVRSELEDTAAATRAGTTGMSDAFKELATESEASTQRISSAFVASAEATVALSRAKDQVRLASREAKTATDDEGAAIAKLAVAQQQATIASTELAAAQKAATQALAGTAGVTEAASAATVGALEREALGARETAVSVRESFAEMSASFAEGAEAAQLGGAGMAAGFSGLSTLLGAGIVIGFFTHFIDEVVKGEVELDHLSAKTGVSIETLAGLRAVVQEAGGQFEPFNQGLVKMEAATQKARDGNEGMILAFKRLGVSAEELKSLSPEQIFFRVAAGISENTNIAQVNSAGIQVMGKGYQSLAAVLRESGGDLEEMTRQAAATSGVTKQSDEAAKEWTRDMAILKETLRSIALGVLPGLIQGLKEVWFAFESASTVALITADAIGAGLRAVLFGMKDIAVLLWDVTTGNFAAFARDAVKAKDNFVGEWKGAAKDISGLWSALNSESQKLFGKAPELAKPKGGDFGGDKEGKDERLKDWQQELQQKRDAEDGFHQVSKAEEAEFWRDKAILARNNVDLYAQVYHLQRDAERQAQKQSLDDEIKGVEDKVKSERAGSLERVVILQEFLQHAKSMGADQTAEYKRLQEQLVTVTREFQEQQAKIVIAGEEQKVAATRKGSEERINAERDVLVTMQRLGLQNTTEYQGQLKKMIEATRDFQVERGKLAQIGAEIEKSVEDHNFAERKKNIEFLAQTGQISKQEELRELIALENAKFQIEYDGMARRIQLASLDPTHSPEQVARLTQQLLKLEQAHELAVTGFTQQQTLARVKIYETFFNQISSGFRSALNGMLTGTQTFSQGMQKMFQSLVLSFIDTLAQMMLKWIAHHVAMVIIRNTTNQAMVASDAVAATESTTISFIASMKKLAHSAVVAAGRAFEAVASIPIIGPVLAPIAAAAAFTAVMGLGALASAERGMVSEKEQLAFIHKNEMVLPAVLSRGFQNLLGGGGTPALAGASSQSTHVSLHMNGGLVDKKFWDDHQGHIVSTIQKAVRKGRF